ncbi:MAG: hypothetical protein IJ328_04550, partial [Muribaculaceae bacterium]|nr:hypothetical protein [Muribaculaceae bacterium]
ARIKLSVVFIFFQLFRFSSPVTLFFSSLQDSLSLKFFHPEQESSVENRIPFSLVSLVLPVFVSIAITSMLSSFYLHQRESFVAAHLPLSFFPKASAKLTPFSKLQKNISLKKTKKLPTVSTTL